MITAVDLWDEVWRATAEDRKLFIDHADSLNLYYEAYPERKVAVE